MKRMKVTLITTMDNEIAFEYQGIYLEFKCFEEQYHEKIKHTSEELLTNWKEDGRGKKTKPTKAHPWKRWKLAA